MNRSGEVLELADLRPGDRVALLPDSKLYRRGFRLGTVTAVGFIKDHFARVAQQIGKSPLQCQEAFFRNVLPPADSFRPWVRDLLFLKVMCSVVVSVRFDACPPLPINSADMAVEPAQLVHAGSNLGRQN